MMIRKQIPHERIRAAAGSTVNKTNHNEKLISLLNFGLEINYFKLKEKLKMK